MTGSELITRFELQVDDSTELSSSESLSILNRVYHKVLTDRPWEFLKKAHTGTTVSGQDYIALPSDFQYLSVNSNYTNTSGNEARLPVVFVGPNYDEYKVVSWSDRRQYRDEDNVCYIDIVNSRLYFAKTPTSAKSVEFDYIYMPDDLTTATSPVFPARFHEILVYGMAVDDSVIQQSDKAKSYAGENNQKFMGIMDDMAYWNANLIQQ